MPSVWEVVSAYLHSGTAAMEASPEPVRGSSNERVAQVRGLLDQIDNDEPKVTPGSAREALRNLFTETEVAVTVAAAPPAAPAAVAEPANPFVHLPAPPAAESSTVRSDPNGVAVDDGVVIDLRDGADLAGEDEVLDRFERVSAAAPTALRRPVREYGTVRRDSADDAVVRWYAMRHGCVPTGPKD